MKMQQCALSEQLDARNSKLRDRVELYATARATHNDRFVSEAIDQIGEKWRGAVAIVEDRKEPGYGRIDLSLRARVVHATANEGDRRPSRLKINTRVAAGLTTRCGLTPPSIN